MSPDLHRLAPPWSSNERQKGQTQTGTGHQDPGTFAPPESTYKMHSQKSNLSCSYITEAYGKTEASLDISYVNVLLALQEGLNRCKIGQQIKYTFPLSNSFALGIFFRTVKKEVILCLRLCLFSRNPNDRK